VVVISIQDVQKAMVTMLVVVNIFSIYNGTASVGGFFDGSSDVSINIAGGGSDFLVFWEATVAMVEPNFRLPLLNLEVQMALIMLLLFSNFVDTFYSINLISYLIL
jgi:hypothetical protein